MSIVSLDVARNAVSPQFPSAPQSTSSCLLIALLTGYWTSVGSHTASVFPGWADQGLALDVAMHIGTLLAADAVFPARRAMLVSGATGIARGRSTPAARRALQIMSATLPVVIAGFLLKDRIESDWRSPILIIVTAAAFASLLWVADRRADRAEGTVDGLSWREAALIEAAQVLVPASAGPASR